MSQEIEIRLGLSDGQQAAATALYCSAFEVKLTPFLGPPERAARFLLTGLVDDRMFTALRAGQVVGLAGFKQGGRGAFEPGFRRFFQEYGITAPLRLAGLLLLERAERPGELLLDGIAVDPEARGQGIGTRLLQAIEEHARALGETSIRLDVIDTNPGARRLYERMGFKAVKTSSTGLLAPFFPFKSSTLMRKALT